MRKQIIHVAQDAIRRNTKEGTNDPAIILRDGSTPSRHHSLDLVLNDGTVVGTFVYQPHDPLSCGARVWLALEPGVVRAVPRDTSPVPVPSNYCGDQ